MTQRLGSVQRHVLTYLAKNPGHRTTAHVFHQICGGRSKTVRALFSAGLVECDAIPAAYVRLTEAGRKAIGAHNAHSTSAASPEKKE